MAGASACVLNQANGGSASGKGIDLPVREVWGDNMVDELRTMVKFLKTGNIWASMDTEFPGTIFGKYNPKDSPSIVYKKLKVNVDNTKIIQLGLTMINSDTGMGIVWEFNFKDFNIECGDRHNPTAIRLLREQKIGFEKNAKYGIDSLLFGMVLKKLWHLFRSNVAWVGFHCGIDFGYMVKMFTGEPLPDKLSDFINLVQQYFGTKVYDIKYMMKDCPGLKGGLQSIARALKVDSFAGNHHRAGYDSCLSLHTFLKMKKQLEHPVGEYIKEVDIQEKYSSRIFGLYPFPAIIQHKDTAHNEKLEADKGKYYDKPFEPVLIQPHGILMVPCFGSNYIST